jgi:zinc transport system permease protein
VTMMAGSIVLGVVFTLVGLWLAYALNLTSGASIILVAGLGFVGARLLEAVFTRRPRAAPSPAAAPNC